MSFPTDILQLLGDTNNRPTTRSAFSPNFDVHETKDSYVLEGEFPGVSDKKNISIEFTDDKTLVVQGRQKKIEGSADQKAEGKKETEKKKEKEKEKAGPKVWISERSTGEFSRSFRFPSDIDVERVKASLEHGILKVVVPKMEKRGTKKIQIS
ncbi:HSP20-like chaperone [Pyronema omphalodes]|nr:HSP20-like chaperone [Pyronema omphalodes]KAI5815687.1 HSP20-like chaperone [Pyronema omphalodes]